MPLARFQATFSQNAINAESGVISGVKVMELGMLATFAGEDGKPRSVTITEAHINALLSHAGNRSIPSHWSHDWFDKDTDPIHERVGALKAFRKDETGSLIADLHLSPGKYRQEALWNASDSPNNMMLSAVFNYNRRDSNYLPTDFQACDLVAKGAATTGLFCKQEPETMELKEFIALLKQAFTEDKEVAALFSKSEAKEEDMKALEDAGGVTDSDRMDADGQQPALMRAQIRIGRAIERKAKASAEEVTAALKKAKDEMKGEFETIAKTEAAKVIGNTAFLRQPTEGNTGETATAKFNAKVKELTDKGVAGPAAITAVINSEPALYAETQSALFKAPAKL